MRSTVRQISIVLLLAVLLSPGLLHARTPVRPTTHATPVVHDIGFFSVVWNLLTNGWLKNGGQLDPSGTTPPPSSTPSGASSTTGDNGGQLDPSGG